MITRYHVLEPRHIKGGLSVEEDDHTVTLFKGKERIAVFGYNTTLQEIHDVADKELAK
jgi:hypothetical protein